MVASAGLLKDQPWSAWPFFGALVLTVIILFEIRGKLEAIRFMMAHDFEKRHIEPIERGERFSD